MAYSPKEPANLLDLEDVVAWMTNELRQIQGEFSETIELELRLRGTIPKKPREGMIVAADGTNWNPGGGKGIYAYLGTTWVKLS
jgi:hypothetical protein